MKHLFQPETESTHTGREEPEQCINYTDNPKYVKLHGTTDGLQVEPIRK